MGLYFISLFILVVILRCGNIIVVVALLLLNTAAAVAVFLFTFYFVSKQKQTFTPQQPQRNSCLHLYVRQTRIHTHTQRLIEKLYKLLITQYTDIYITLSMYVCRHLKNSK